MLVLTELEIAQNRGDAVISLLARAEVAPVPAVYGLAYDYVAGEQTIGALRMGGIVDTGGPADEASKTRLYEEFVRPYELGEAFDRVIATMVERLGALDAMLSERQEASRSQSKSLAAVGAQLEDQLPSPKLMREWIIRLALANDEARRASLRLTNELHVASEKLNGARQEMAQLSKDALIDPVTGAANRTGLDAALAAAVVEARSAATGLAVAVVDIDHFKRFNDMYGHPVGDEVLRIVTRALRASTRTSDVVGRMGGDEFVVIMRDARQGAAYAAADAMRRAVIESDLTRVLGPEILGNITASIGIAHFQADDTIATILARADGCLFDAKRDGRNRVAGDEPRPDAVAA